MPEAGESSAATKLRDEAEELAGKMSLRTLTPQEYAEGVDIIFDLLAHDDELRRQIATLAADLEMERASRG